MWSGQVVHSCHLAADAVDPSLPDASVVEQPHRFSGNETLETGPPKSSNEGLRQETREINALPHLVDLTNVLSTLMKS
jgi:hypothetical protein